MISRFLCHCVDFFFRCKLRLFLPSARSETLPRFIFAIFYAPLTFRWRKKSFSLKCIFFFRIIPSRCCSDFNLRDIKFAVQWILMSKGFVLVAYSILLSLVNKLSLIWQFDENSIFLRLRLRRRLHRLCHANYQQCSLTCKCWLVPFAKPVEIWFKAIKREFNQMIAENFVFTQLFYSATAVAWAEPET